MIEFTDIMREYFLLYNGPECGASAPDHAHFQACSKEESMQGSYYDHIDLIDNDKVRISYEDFPYSFIRIQAKNKKTMSKTFHLIYDILAANNNGKEPMMIFLPGMVWKSPKSILERTTTINLSQWPNTLTIVLSSYAANIVPTAITQKETNKFSSVLL